MTSKALGRFKRSQLVLGSSQWFCHPASLTLNIPLNCSNIQDYVCEYLFGLFRFTAQHDLLFTLLDT